MVSTKPVNLKFPLKLMGDIQHRVEVLKQHDPFNVASLNMSNFIRLAVEEGIKVLDKRKVDSVAKHLVNKGVRRGRYARTGSGAGQ